MSLRLLAVGDMHLGRRPSRLPAPLAEHGDALGPAGAWQRTVEAAIEATVDAVVLAGDVIEKPEDFFEGYGELARGVARLTEAGIHVLGVVGNHDVKVLPRLADQIPAFELLGRDGQWQSAAIEASGERLTLWGWSFPREVVRFSPLEGQRFERGPGVNLGLLHCDRDQSGSRHAPVRSAELADAGLDGWLLGHIHKPDSLTAPNPSGYLGSLTGMDPGEHGARGPWLLTIEGGRVESMEQWRLAPLRWERVDLDLTGLEEAEQVQDRLLQEVRALDEDWAERDRPLEAVGIRLRLVGRSNLAEAAAEALGPALHEALFRGARGTHYFLEKLLVEALPEIPLDQLAEANHPAGLLARRLRLLDGPADDSARQRLIEEGRRRLQARLGESRWQALADGGLGTDGMGADSIGRDSLDEQVVVDYLRRAGTRMLERMLASRGDLG
ncbi:DNA repair exonuclease [Gammaproteobacteria bacterium AB-CW1]|uniref:DNA repair exonuclease n=1 Tax=Natronospira elongata TaxID=3110268 RepID=A0AAP6JGZ4_9GAMM|nr:DNA repair exonuclease [Gammaproteobacteria bacterium AB-CW1]MEA5446302.1 DNA repair exonuclease [Gammaproteobacteria bacterium AB-CW1]